MSPAYRVTDLSDPSLRPSADVGDYGGVILTAPDNTRRPYRVHFDAAGVIWADDLADAERQLVAALHVPNGPVIDLSRVRITGELDAG